MSVWLSILITSHLPMSTRGNKNRKGNWGQVLPCQSSIEKFALDVLSIYKHKQLGIRGHAESTRSLVLYYTQRSVLIDTEITKAFDVVILIPLWMQKAIKHWTRRIGFVIKRIPKVVSERSSWIFFSLYMVCGGDGASRKHKISPSH